MLRNLSTRILAVLLTLSVIPAIMIPAYAESVTLEKTHSYRLIDDNNATCGDAVSSGTVLTTGNALYIRYVVNYPPIRCDLSVAEWDISSIPSGAVISDVSVRDTGSGTGATSCDVMSFPNQRSSYTDFQLISRLASNTDRIADNSSVCNSSDMVSLGEGAITYVQSQIDNNKDTVTIGAMYDERSINERRQSLGTSTSELTITYTVPDLIPPTITLMGSNPQTIVIENDYTELGATCNDDIDGDISSSIIVDSSSVNTSSVGQYQVTYDCADSSSNDAVQVTRTVNVVAELVPPTITPPDDITADATGEHTTINIGTATATDNFDPSPTITNDAPDSFPHGITTVTWTATDSSGNQSSATQIITVFAEYVQSVEGNYKVAYHEKYEDGTTAIISKLHDSRITTFNCQSLEKTPWNNSTDQWVNQTGVGVFYGTFNSTNSANHFRCYDGNGDILFTATSYPDDYNGISLGFDVLNDAFGEDGGILGVPVFVMFVIAVASMATRNNAPDFVIIILAIIGIGGVLGMMVIDDALWGLLLAIGAIVVLVGRKLYT